MSKQFAAVIGLVVFSAVIHAGVANVAQTGNQLVGLTVATVALWGCGFLVGRIVEAHK